ncbi:hypothetical protein L2E82_00415 [Cichorium intybus]|uniref:Uncharacterized protein n=1 Tax=Cichorium intybus TaxID=13427 RepID=A0ACB9GWT3_CICIN|nr:hypothetical protein L2E82_00415 [Cichorium intybus]
MVDGVMPKRWTLAVLRNGRRSHTGNGVGTELYRKRWTELCQKRSLELGWSYTKKVDVSCTQKWRTELYRKWSWDVAIPKMVDGDGVIPRNGGQSYTENDVRLEMPL